MSVTHIESKNNLLEKILDASLGEVVTILEKYLDDKISLELIEQNTSQPGNKFYRKIIVTAGGLPLIRAVIKFDKKFLPSYIVRDLLQKQMKVGSILQRHGIQNEKNTVFLRQDENKVFRIYEIKNNNKIWFEIHEEIMLNHLNSVQSEFTLEN